MLKDEHVGQDYWEKALKLISAPPPWIKAVG
jgi:hypothetical protein